MHGTKMKKPRYKVSIVKGDNPEDTVRKAIELIGGIDSYVKARDKVLIKPNLCTRKRAETGATTDPDVVRAIIDQVQKETEDVSIIESDCPAIGAEIVWSYCGYTELAKGQNACLINLSKEPCLTYKDYDLPKILFENPNLINMPKMKTNDITVVSCSLKNLFGLIPNKHRARYHNKIDQVIVDLNEIFKQSLIVVDGLTGMEGDGPINGQPVEMDIVVVGNNPVAVDSVVCHLMGVDPQDVDHIRMAAEADLGPIDIGSIDLSGDEINEVKKEFTLPGDIMLKQKLKYKLLENSENILLKQAIDTLGWIRRKTYSHVEE